MLLIYFHNKYFYNEKYLLIFLNLDKINVNLFGIVKHY